MHAAEILTILADCHFVERRFLLRPSAAPKHEVQRLVIDFRKMIDGEATAPNDEMFRKCNNGLSVIIIPPSPFLFLISLIVRNYALLLMAKVFKHVHGILFSTCLYCTLILILNRNHSIARSSKTPLRFLLSLLARSVVLRSASKEIHFSLLKRLRTRKEMRKRSCSATADEERE